MEQLGTDLGRAFTGGVLGGAVGTVGTVGVSLVPWGAWWIAAPGSLLLVGGAVLIGASVALAIGDWWDRRR